MANAKEVGLSVKLSNACGEEISKAYYMSSNGLKSVEVEKDLGIMITSDLKCSQQCEYAYSKANRVMGMIRRTISSVKESLTDGTNWTNMLLKQRH